MEPLTVNEKQFMEMFRHFRATEGNGFSAAQALKVYLKFLNSDGVAQMETILKSLADKGLVNIEKNIDHPVLTAQGEKFLYGEYTLAEGIKILCDYVSAQSQPVKRQDVIDAKDEIFSPIYSHKLNDILGAAISDGNVKSEGDVLRVEN